MILHLKRCRMKFDLWGVENSYSRHCLEQVYNTLASCNLICASQRHPRSRGWLSLAYQWFYAQYVPTYASRRWLCEVSKATHTHNPKSGSVGSTWICTWTSRAFPSYPCMSTHALKLAIPRSSGALSRWTVYQLPHTSLCIAPDLRDHQHPSRRHSSSWKPIPMLLGSNFLSSHTSNRLEASRFPDRVHRLDTC